MSEIEIKKIARGRPKKIETIETITPTIITPIENEIQKIPRGRPKKFFNLTVKDYNAQYYENNKEKTKGSCLCKECNFLISKSNKSRHFQSKFHKDKLSEIEEDEYYDKLIKENETIKELIN